MSAKHPTVSFSPGQNLRGFTVTDVMPLPDLRVVAQQFRHEKSGARLLHLQTDDPENLFAVAFRTPPPDDTGLPHILEHSVLCGSQKYPVKDPFAVLLQISLATFLNAMTYPDKTVYPCASMNQKDFLNLMSVYCDAVFRPQLTEMFFKQEGHHLDFADPENPESPLTISGVVYNEMKGAYSSLDGIIGRKIGADICPDNAYGRDSGGNPDVIPELTYDQFVQFHRTYYHPTNSLIVLYGSIDVTGPLELLDRHYLAAFDRLDVQTEISDQPRWDAPRRETVSYPIGPNEDPARKTAVVLTFLANDIRDAVDTLAMQVLEYYLFGHAASPLRKALIDSQLGEELTHSGYDHHQRDTAFSVGLKGSEADRAGKIEDLVKTTCADLARQGLDKDKVETALHRLELSACEIGSMYPLRLMDRVYQSWLYEGDPLHNLRINEHLAELRKRVEAEPGFLEARLRTMIAENPHYTVHTFVPDKDYMARREDAFRSAMDERKQQMSPAEREAIRKEATALRELQSKPNTPEDLATLPRLGIGDVPPEPYELPTRTESVAGRPCLLTDLFANGVNYIDLAFDLRGLDEDLIDWMPLFAGALTKMGAAGLDYAALAEREAACSGGTHAGASAGGRVDDAQHVQPFLSVQIKALDHKLEDMLGVLSDRVLRADFTDRDRLRDVILQGRVHRHAHIIPGGSHFAMLHALRHLSRNGELTERFSGITQVRQFDRMAERFDNDQDAIVERLQRIQRFVLARDRLFASVVADEPQQKTICGWLQGLTGELERADVPEASSDFTPEAGTREAVAAPANVAFVAAGLPALQADHPDAPALLLLGLQLSYGHLWNELRVKRGAYGAHAGYHPANGTFTFSSYRDPCIQETLDTYARVFDYVATDMDLSPAAVEQAVIGTLKAQDRPIRPPQAAGTALGRDLNGETPAFRKAFRQRLLSLTADDIRRASAEVLAPAFAQAATCVLSGREKLEAANKALDRPLAISDL